MERKTDLESILIEIGSVGRAQNFYFFLICFISFFCGSITMIYAFTAGDLNYRCYIDECDNSDISVADYNPEWLKYAVPFDERNKLPENCFVYEFTGDRNKSGDLCDLNDFNNRSKIKCDKFIFETNEQTILTEYNLTCNENKWKLTLPGTIHGAGKSFNMLMIGYFSDRFGRKRFFIVSSIISSIFALAQLLAFNYWWFLLLTFLETCLGGGTYSVAAVLGLELVSPEYRTAVGTVMFAIGSLGTIYYGYVAMLVLNWKTLIMLCYIPSCVIITYIWLLPESIKWLQVKGRYKEIAKILLTIIKWNNIKVSIETHDVLVNKPEKMFENTTKFDASGTTKSNEKFPIRDVLHSRPMILRMLCLGFCWFANLFIFYGLSLISVSIGGNKFTDFIITSSMEVPACALVLLASNRIGRKTIVCSAFLTSGSALLIYTFVSHIYWIKMILFMVGKFAISVSFCTMFIFTSEMVPTNLRQTLIGVCSTFGRIGSLTAPQAPLLEIVMKNLSIYLFAGFGLVGGLMALRFPETLNCKLPDTIEEALQIGKQKPNKSDVT